MFKLFTSMVENLEFFNISKEYEPEIGDNKIKN